ncbi:craniofacial development protein 2 [Biomphalaria glabrata]|nr:craniofacial development protein 2 [Biomphalaria glabrata]
MASQGSLTERWAGYTLYWSGRGPEEHRQSGVAFMVKQSLTKKLLDIPVGHSDRLMSLRLPLDGTTYVIIISAYAPTLLEEPETKERFYADLRRVLCKVDTTDKLIIMGDFNAQVRNDYSAWPGVLGRHGIGNYNGRLLLELCSIAKLAITNAIFQQKKNVLRPPGCIHAQSIEICWIT